MISTNPNTATTESDSPAEDRVHHHARLRDDAGIESGAIVTLCGLHLPAPRPGARRGEASVLPNVRIDHGKALPLIAH